jgi:hypothetical protein
LSDIQAPYLRFDVVPLAARPALCQIDDRPVQDGDAIELVDPALGWMTGFALSAATIEGRDGLFLVVELTDGRVVLVRFDECRRPTRLLN